LSLWDTESSKSTCMAVVEKEEILVNFFTMFFFFCLHYHVKFKSSWWLPTPNFLALFILIHVDLKPGLYWLNHLKTIVAVSSEDHLCDTPFICFGLWDSYEPQLIVLSILCLASSGRSEPEPELKSSMSWYQSEMRSSILCLW
jgi:hypothetical protein